MIEVCICLFYDCTFFRLRIPIPSITAGITTIMIQWLTAEAVNIPAQFTSENSSQNQPFMFDHPKISTSKAENSTAKNAMFIKINHRNLFHICFAFPQSLLHTEQSQLLFSASASLHIPAKERPVNFAMRKIRKKIRRNVACQRKAARRICRLIERDRTLLSATPLRYTATTAMITATKRPKTVRTVLRISLFA